MVPEFDTPEQIANLALFRNLQSSKYWGGNRFEPNPTSAWYFDADDGFVGFDQRFHLFYAVAVRDGDVTQVPEPQTLTLALLALGATVMVRRRRLR